MMISSNPTGLVETISQGPKTGFPRGQACLSVSVCTLGPHLSRRKDFILITCVHRERLCVCNGGEQPAVPCLSTQHLISHSGNLGCCGEGEIGGGHSGPSAMDTPSPRASPCSVAEDREVRNHTEPFLPQKRTANITSTYYSWQELITSPIQMQGNW